ncbi:hypothetical protein P8H80_003243 [Escherichia coli]|nr:hypothetical protein [Escherichia coli]
METMDRKLLARFYTEKLVPTGTREVTDLADIDAAFCNNILRAFKGVLVSDERRETAPFKAWLERQPSDQLIFGEFDDVPSFLRAFQSSQTGRSQETGTRNKIALPIINISRTVDFSLYVGEITRDMPWCGTLVNSKGETYAVLSKTHAEISYNVTIIASERHTLSRMSTTFGSWLCMLATHGVTNFQAKTKLADAEIILGAELTDPKGVVFSNVSIPQNEDRVYANQALITVIADIMVAEGVASKPTQINVMAGVTAGGHTYHG